MQKFENVDILKSLKAIMQTHTEHFQSDFDIDVETLKEAAKSQNPEDKKHLWLCRTAGTWCLRERDTFIRDTREHNTFCFYAEQTRDKILAYAVEVTGMERGKVTGNLYELDYQKHYQHVKDVSLPAGDTKLIYEHGERTQEAGQRISGNADPDLGKFLRFEAQPKDPAALRGVLWDEQYHRDHFDSGNIKEHIEKLSGRKHKPSLRKQLAKDKEAVKTAPKKQAVKSKNKELEV
ncbi:hypothetical protein [Eubacterium sp. 1001713B170207_170306_E7]|uniref:hypothetical protein n=1 Tax=Eubacterium sp. 1001713B170207_170306_E7 TaxID=2787097 RepID=UPI001898F2A9|nr:hypothetical protein [Eubacterium sp. 1001713B170207_170306_E7]